MAALDPDAISTIVYLQARGRPPAEISQVLKDEFGVDLPPSQVARYNPNSPTGRKLPPHFTKLFRKERDRFYRELEAIPIGSKAFRLQAYQEIYDSAGKNLHAKVTALKESRQEMEGDKVTLQGVGRNGAILTENRPALGTSQAAAVLAAMLELPADADADVVDADVVDNDGNQGVSQVIEPG